MRPVLVALLVLVLPIPATAQVRRVERDFLAAVNAERVERGGSRLVMGKRLAAYADRHSGDMREAGYLFHSDLSFPKADGWDCAGENIGVGPSVQGLHDAFMDSPEHRRNILSECYERVGIGVKRDGGRLWVTFDFLG